MHHTWEDEGAQYFLLDLYTNTLDDYLGKYSNDLSIYQAWSFLCDIANGLAAMHANRIIHRDFHTKNVCVRDGRAYIIDLSCAKLLTKAPERGEGWSQCGYVIPPELR